MTDNNLKGSTTHLFRDFLSYTSAQLQHQYFNGGHNDLTTQRIQEVGQAIKALDDQLEMEQVERKS